MIVISIIDYIVFDKNKQQKAIESFVQINKLPGIVQSVSYVEPRFIAYKDDSTIIYPQLTKLSFSKIIYE